MFISHAKYVGTIFVLANQELLNLYYSILNTSKMFCVFWLTYVKRLICILDYCIHERLTRSDAKQESYCINDG